MWSQQNDLTHLRSSSYRGVLAGMEKREGGVMDKCTGVMGYLLGHSFTTAVTKGAVVDLPRMEGNAYAVAKLLDAHREQTYHGIYCKRCGKVINA